MLWDECAVSLSLGDVWMAANVYLYFQKDRFLRKEEGISEVLPVDQSSSESPYRRLLLIIAYVLSLITEEKVGRDADNTSEHDSILKGCSRPGQQNAAQTSRFREKIRPYGYLESP